MLKKLDAGAFLIEEGEKVLLGIPTGRKPRQLAGADRMAIKRTPGLWADAQGKMNPWFIQGFQEREEQLTALGPAVGESRSLEALLEEPTLPDLSLLRRLIPALKAFCEEENNPGGLYTRGIRLLSAGGVFLVPGPLSAFARRGQNRQDFQKTWEAWNHPDREGQEAWSFSLGALAWYLLTREEPYPGNSQEERREKIRRGALPDPAAAIPGLKAPAARLLQRALTPQPGGLPSWEEWETLLQEGFLQELSPRERSQAEAKAVQVRRQREKEFQQRRKLRQQRTVLAVGAAGVLLLAFVLYGGIKKALTPPSTAELTPLELVHTYYESINSLDTMVLEECLAKKGPRNDLRMVTQFFVSGQVRLGYEGQTGFVPALEWEAQGPSAFPPDTWPWGIVDLEIEPQGENRFQARYTRWGPRPDAAGEGLDPELSLTVVDVLTLVQGRQAWEIVDIQREYPSLQR